VAGVAVATGGGQPAVAAILFGAGAGLVVFGIGQRRWWRRLGTSLEAIWQRLRDLGVPLSNGPVQDPREIRRRLQQVGDFLTSTVARMRAESRLVRSILEAMREGVMAVDRDGRIVLVNTGMQRLGGFSEGALGMAPGEVLKAPELVEAIETALGGAPCSREVVLGEGNRQVLMANVSPLADGEGALLVVHDTTETHRIHQVRRDFVANVSHELRNPLATIQGAVETLQGIWEEREVSEDEQRLLDSVARQTARMSALVRDLLGLARLESGQETLRCTEVELGEFLASLLTAFQERAERKGIMLQWEAARGEPLPCLVDPSALHTVVGNLVDNAIRYSRPGDRVQVVASAGGPGEVCLEVRDTGPGIAEEHLPRLFERFYRVDPGRSREEGGTGLGLALVKHLVAAMGGQVSVQSTPGRGTIFTVRLPRGAGGGVALPESDG